jgi:hypothetical protein
VATSEQTNELIVLSAHREDDLIGSSYRVEMLSEDGHKIVEHLPISIDIQESSALSDHGIFRETVKVAKQGSKLASWAFCLSDHWVVHHELVVPVGSARKFEI